MIDIHFYQAMADIKKRMMSGEKLDRQYVMDYMEEHRNKTPVVYNIESTNACNMTCPFCP